LWPAAHHGRQTTKDDRLSHCYNPDMVKGIEHTAIASPDPHKLAHWYVEHLDFVVNYQSSNSKTTFVKASDGSMIEIIESNGAPPAALDMKAAGLRHLAIAVADFDAVYERLKDPGCFIPDRAGEEGPGTRWCSSPTATGTFCICCNGRSRCRRRGAYGRR